MYADEFDPLLESDKVMPEIRQDLLVHTHDIHLPFSFTQNQVLEKHIYWTEQYLFYAYMLDNPKIKVLFGSAYAKKNYQSYSSV